VAGHGDLGVRDAGLELHHRVAPLARDVLHAADVGYPVVAHGVRGFTINAQILKLF
jgi:hypothetical protein